MRIASLAIALSIIGSAPAQADQERLLVLSGKEHALILVDPNTGQREALFRVGLGPEDVAVSKDGRTAVVTNRGDELSGTTITVLDLAANKVARTITLEVRHTRPDGTEQVRRYHRPTGVTFLEGRGKVVVACAGEGALLLIDLETGRVEGELRLDSRDPLRTIVGHGGRYAFVTSATSGTVSVVDTTTMRIVRTIEAGGGATGIALHPTLDEAWVVNAEVNSISIIDTKEMVEVVEFACGAMPTDIAFTLDGRFALVTNMQEGNISVFDAKTRRVHTVVDLETVTQELADSRPAPTAGSFGKSAFPTRLLMHPSGKSAFVATLRNDRVTEIDLATWRPLRKLDVPQLPASMAWSQIASGAVGARAVPSPEELRRAVGETGK
ncbi:MAG: cytochrome D1 domain-containing protein [Planctomycetota bacterium]